MTDNKLTDEDEMIAAAESVKRQCFEARHHDHHGTLLLTASSCIGSLLDKLRAPVAQRDSIPPLMQVDALTDDFLRAWWRLNDGKFHGPNVETGTMPEAKLLPLLRHLLSKLCAATSAPAEKGERAVPREPTEAMLDAADHHVHGNGRFAFINVWQAMFDASPQSPPAEPAACPYGCKTQEEHEAHQLGLAEALRPFVDAYRKHADPIGDSDLYNEQPRAVFVTLGDCRKAARILAAIPMPGVSPK